MPHAQCPMPHAPCPMPNAQCPMPMPNLRLSGYSIYLEPLGERLRPIC
ncbi:hypothetical protein [Nostoc sp.]